MNPIQQPICGDEQVRRALITGQAGANGIDYLEVSPDHTTLTVYFLNPVAPANPANPADTNDAYGLSVDLSKITITGGTRIVGITAQSARRNPAGTMTIVVSHPGDYSTYVLALDVPALDILFRQVAFSFMANCPVDFDCRQTNPVTPAQVAEMLLDYEAKDYASFRKLMLDLLPQLNPNFTERNPSDFGIAVVEVLAFVADRLSYFQDAVANEAYLGTLRQRISARRQAKLVDYPMDDGRNAWAYVHIAVTRKLDVPLGTKLVTRISMPLPEQAEPPGTSVDGTLVTAATLQSDPALVGAAVFETTFPARLHPRNNLIFFHTWGNQECCLGRGTTEVFLYSVDAATGKASRPRLKNGDFLLIEEVLGLDTGLPADADASHRQVVRINQDPDDSVTDPLFSSTLLPGGILQAIASGMASPPWPNPGVLGTSTQDGTVVWTLVSVGSPAPWAPSTAYAAGAVLLDSNNNVQQATTAGTSGSGPQPTWATTVGAPTEDGTVTWQLVSLGAPGSAWATNTAYPAGTVIVDTLGNWEQAAASQSLPLLQVTWATADALTFPFNVSERLSTGALVLNLTVARGNIVTADHGITATESLALDAPLPDTPPYRPRLSNGPLTMEMLNGITPQYDPLTGRLSSARRNLDGPATQAQPALSLFVAFTNGTSLWTSVADLLESTGFDPNFVAEMDNDGFAVLRFGDDEYGRAVTGATAITATYRVGNGLVGNVGAESIAHIAPDSALADVTLVRNPLPAQDGADPETIADVQQWAPEAFQAVQYRAVTEADYANAAQLLPEVQSSVASFRWTGSWYTAFVGIMPSDPANLISEPKGVLLLAPALENTVKLFLEGYRLAGYDIEIRPPQFLALELDLLVCASAGFFTGDVQQAVEAALSDTLNPDGSRGFFYPGNFNFGQPVYLSQIYGAVQQVQGVSSVVVTKFVQFGQQDNGELANAVMPVGPWQIAQLDNDPNFMERGVLNIVMRGGKL